MEFFSEGSLADKLRAGSIGFNEIGSIVEQIAGAIDYAHKQGFIHHDIKPANILLDQGRTVLSDFGIARVVGEQVATQTGGITGTPAYMAPEQAMGNKVDFTADIYSLAVVTFEMLTNKLPFESSSPFATLHAIINESPPSLINLNSKIPRAVEEVVLKGLNKLPEQRFKSATEFAQALNEAFRTSRKLYLPQIVGRQKFSSLVSNLSAKKGLVLIFLTALLGSFIGAALAMLLLAS